MNLQEIVEKNNLTVGDWVLCTYSGTSRLETGEHVIQETPNGRFPMLKKYLPDEEGDYHFICQTGEKDGLNTYNFFTNQTSKIEVKPLSDMQGQNHET